MTESTPRPPTTPAPGAAKTEPDPWLALEQSGGFRFVTRQLLIFQDGRTTITSSALDQPVSGRLSKRRLAALRRLVKQLDPPAASGTDDPGPPDGFTYDLTVRVGRATHRLVVADGGIPATLVPLLGSLKDVLLAPERDDRAGH